MARLDRAAVCLRALDGAQGNSSQRQGAARGDAVRRIGRRGRGPVPGRGATRRPAHAAARYCHVYSGLSLLYREVRTAGHRPVSALPATARRLRLVAPCASLCLGATCRATPGVILWSRVYEEGNDATVIRGAGVRCACASPIPRPHYKYCHTREGSLCTHSVPIPILLKVSAVVSCCRWALRPASRCLPCPSRVPRPSGGPKRDSPNAAASYACVAMTPCTSITTSPTTPGPAPR